MRPLRTVVCCTVILGLAIPIGAEEFITQIKKGTIDVNPSGSIAGQFAIAGTRGFTFDATFDSGSSSALCQPCAAGETISLSTEISPQYSGTATYRGRTYVFDFNTGGGAVTLQAPSFTLPAQGTSEPQTVTLTTPFTVGPDAVLTLQDGETSHVLTLNGSGTATATFTVHYDETLQRHLYQFDSLNYVFDE